MAIPDFVLESLVAHHARGGTVASVCAGAEALGRAGLLDGRRCTTHHEHQDELAARYPRAHVVRDVLFTEDGGVVTSAGIASGIDLALHLVAKRHGAALAARIAREMVIYTRRNGEAAQESAMLRHRVHLSDQVHRAQELIDARFAAPLRLAELAAAVGRERTHADPPVHPDDRADAAALPADAAARARRSADRAWQHGRVRSAVGRFRRRPDAAPAACRFSVSGPADRRARAGRIVL